MSGQSTRREFLRNVAGAAALSTLVSSCQIHKLSPRCCTNIVLLVADDLGYGDLSCYGCEDIQTPAIDTLAAEGVRFTSFYANAPECSPTRTALLTGRYQHRVGGLECAIGIGNVGRYDEAIALSERHELGLPVEETTIVRLLKNAGYRTAICGKWHLGYERKFSPVQHGFDYAFGPLGGAVDYFHHCEYTGEPMLFCNDQPIQAEGHLTDLITEEAIRFIHNTPHEPFFLYVPYTAPHTPYQAREDKKPDYIRQEDYNKGTRETFASMVGHMDEGIAQILKALQDEGLTDNTLVIFMSDNGANRTGRNAPYSGHKGGLLEGGIRVPCVVRWPGKIPKGIESEQPCMTMDFSASITRVAGARLPRQRSFDGIDILERVETNQPVAPRTLYWRARRGEVTRKAVRSGDLKYLYEKKGAPIREYLFDLAHDPGEKNNLFSKRKEEVQRLKQLLATWEIQVKPRRV